MRRDCIARCLNLSHLEHGHHEPEVLEVHGDAAEGDVHADLLGAQTATRANLEPGQPRDQHAVQDDGEAARRAAEPRAQGVVAQDEHLVDARRHRRLQHHQS